MSNNIELKKKFEKAIEHLQREVKKIKTSHVTPDLLENIYVEAYGTKSQLSQVASITNQGPQVLIIQPWDQGIIKEIEKAIIESDTDINPVSEKNFIRINFPPLTEEKRKETVKILNERLEDTRINIRKIREEYLKILKEKEKVKEISEDEYFNIEKEVQKTIDEYNNKIKEIGQKKEEEIMTI